MPLSEDGKCEICPCELDVIIIHSSGDETKSKPYQACRVTIARVR
jgi:hypothetical protein